MLVFLHLEFVNDEPTITNTLFSALISNVTDAVEMLIQHFSTATDQAELAFLGDSKQSPACAKIALNALCPALYAVFRDGLKENIETSFGAVNNSVWQMVEATARQGLYSFNVLSIEVLKSSQNLYVTR